MRRIACAVALAAASFAAVAQPVMEPGAWELQTVMTAQDPEDGSPDRAPEPVVGEVVFVARWKGSA